MSLSIDINTVTEVLLADGWHNVLANSFTMDSYEFLSGEMIEHRVGASGICPAGFSFLTTTRTSSATVRIAGPLTSILAVSYSDGSGER